MFHFEAIRPYVDFVTNRACKAGFKAYQDGFERRAPVEVGEYAGAWVEGWNAAAIDALNAPTAAVAAA
jgi:hypothetical protein